LREGEKVLRCQRLVCLLDGVVDQDHRMLGAMTDTTMR
jgi:hypothetical protein